jgi:thiol-disulfide isomerase/thioredoxin
MQQLTEETVGKFIAGNPYPMVILFYTKDSAATAAFLSKFEEFEKKYPKVQFYAADVSEDTDPLRERYAVTETPAALLIISGNAVERYANANGLSEEQLAELFNYIET